MKFSKIQERERLTNEEILKITDHLKRLDQRTAAMHVIAFIFFYIIYIFWPSPVFLLNSVVFSGIAVTLLFRRMEDIRIGGVLTFPLLLYYTLSDSILPVHFFTVVALSIPIAVFLMRKNIFGQTLFYRLALLTIPITSISYFAVHYLFEVVEMTDLTFTPRVVIYMLLPHIYVYNLLRLPKNKIVQDLITTVGLLTIMVVLWVAILSISYVI